MSNTLEAKICVLGAQGVGKTSLVKRYVKGTFDPSTTTSTVGAAFQTKRAHDTDSGTTVRLQVWDTAGQERFHSITRLYYRGASAVILVYSIVDERSFEEMGRWLREVKQNCAEDVIVHVVGTKSDAVALDPSSRQVPFERCIEYVAENLYPTAAPAAANIAAKDHALVRPSTPGGIRQTPAATTTWGVNNSKRNSGLWGQEAGWDVCHEISASSGEGIEEVFRVVTRKLVEQSVKRTEVATHAFLESRGVTPACATLQTGGAGSTAGYFDQRPNTNNGHINYYNGTGHDGTGAGGAGRISMVGRGSFRLGTGDKRRSWLLGFPTPNISICDESAMVEDGKDQVLNKRSDRCC